MQQIGGFSYGLALGLGKVEEEEDEEDGKEDGEGEEDVVAKWSEEEREAEGDEEIGRPVDEHSDGGGSRSGPLGEHLSR